MSSHLAAGWGWYQAILDLDTDAARHPHPLPGVPLTRSPRVIVVNLALIFALIVAAGAVYALHADAM